jgi:hypothetical protein
LHSTLPAGLHSFRLLQLISASLRFVSPSTSSAACTHLRSLQHHFARFASGNAVFGVGVYGSVRYTFRFNSLGLFSTLSTAAAQFRIVAFRSPSTSPAACTRFRFLRLLYFVFLRFDFIGVPSYWTCSPSFSSALDFSRSCHSLSTSLAACTRLRCLWRCFTSLRPCGFQVPPHSISFFTASFRSSRLPWLRLPLSLSPPWAAVHGYLCVQLPWFRFVARRCVSTSLNFLRIRFLRNHFVSVSTFSNSHFVSYRFALNVFGFTQLVPSVIYLVAQCCDLEEGE